MMSRLLHALLVLAALAGCTELRGRKKIQEGTAAYKRGDFPAAVDRFTEATALVPEMPVAWLNLGYSCRELIIPGAASAVNRAAALCALSAFRRLRALAPEDVRGDRLYVQTLFDVGEYKTIERTFNLRHEKNPTDLDAVLALEQVYVKLGLWRDALTFYRKAAALRSEDAAAQYAVGTYVWQLLATRGGGPTVEKYDPRARPDRPPPPAGAAGDIVGADRLALADEGLRYLQRALGLRPRYPEALTYIGLLYRQKSFALFDDPAAWEQTVAQSVAYAGRGAEKP